MKVRRALGRSCAGVVLAAALSGCGDDAESPNSTSSGSCVLGVEFRGTAYSVTSEQTADDVERGKKLGSAARVRCGNADGPSDSDLDVYAVVGRSPSEVILAESVFNDADVLVRVTGQ